MSFARKLPEPRDAADRTGRLAYAACLEAFYKPLLLMKQQYSVSHQWMWGLFIAGCDRETVLDALEPQWPDEVALARAETRTWWS